LAATAQALYAFAPAMINAVLTSASGWIYGAGPMPFLFMAMLCAAAVPVAWMGLGTSRGSF
jgi:hypothetical protein